MEIGIIGGGAGGMMSASIIKNHNVTILERNEKLGKKMYITGKGRCNITNNSPIYEFVEHIINGKKFLTTAIHTFTPQNLMEFLHDNGLRTKTERGSRVIPCTDKSSDVIKAFNKAIERNNVTVKYGEHVSSIYKTDDKFYVNTNNGSYLFDIVIIATGGSSYKLTGSTGDGYKFAEKLGHTIIPPVPALSSIILKDDVKCLEGLSLKNVRASVTYNKKTYSHFGEMLFTNNGVSGPIILSLSSLINRLPLNSLDLIIDFKPALSPDTLDERLQNDIGELPNKNMSNLLTSLLPKSIIPLVLSQSGVDGDLKGHSLTKNMRYALGFSVKNLKFSINRLSSIDDCIITSGGVSTKEINSSTMESKLVKGLYFVGEVVDVDALTGGYNLQIALSTGHLAGKKISEALC